MSHFQLVFSSIMLFFLIFLSGFFSTAETSLMAINRYRLRHRARLKKRSALLIMKLLKRPDRLLGMVLIGNCLANIVAAALATLIAEYYYGEVGVLVATILLTLVILIFAEVAPKTVAVLYPERVSKAIAWPVYISLLLFYPLVWFINTVANGLLRLLQIKTTHSQAEALSREELRSVVFETTGKTSRQYQHMLLGILDLNKVLVDDVMIPQHEIIGIDIEQPWSEIQTQLASSPHDWLPVYRESINEVIGVLHLRELMGIYARGLVLDKDALINHLQEPYFIPEGTSLNTQLLHFQAQRRRVALVVDEYGEIHGLVSLEDILEEIVGEFTTSVVSPHKLEMQSDGSYLANGAITIRELNRTTHWELPTDNARTLSGLIIDYLESMPHAGTCVRIAGHPIEIIRVKDNRVTTARLFPRSS